MPPPRALRVATLRDRLVLQDVTGFLRGRDPAARNALIDAANAASRAAAAAPPPVPSLIDLPEAGGGGSRGAGEGRYLVLPFDGAEMYEVGDAAAAGMDGEAAALVDAAAGFLGVLRLWSAMFAVFVSQIRRAGSLPAGEVMAVHRVKLVKLGDGPPAKMDRDFAGAIVKLLEGGALYYSLDEDLTRSLDKGGGGGDDAGGEGNVVGNAFWWTWPMARRGGPVAVRWALRTVCGYVGSEAMRFSMGGLGGGGGGGFAESVLPVPGASPGTREFLLTLVSRRSRRRAGARYIIRGVDAMGDVANFVETEQVVWAPADPGVYSSFTVIRGSVPVFWRQNNGIARPNPELDSALNASRTAFSAHFRNMVRSYGGVVALSLVDMHGSEAVLAEAFERHFELDIAGSFEGLNEPKLVSFDFHAHCGGKEYERGAAMLLSQLCADVQRFGFFAKGVDAPGVLKHQSGVFRVNCVDCLDRTNVVQSMLARVALDMQLRAIFRAGVRTSGDFGEDGQDMSKLYHDSEDRFKHVWGDNADAVSKQYSGTGAMKTDFTRTGKRSTQGMLGDGVKSVVRMYYKNFVDEGRQEAINILCGNASVRPRARVDRADDPLDGPDGDERASPKVLSSDVVAIAGPGASSLAQRSESDMSALWYSFIALRLNGSGDKQQVRVELRDNVMLLATPEGVNFEYPRHGLLLWDKGEDAKSGDRKQASRLRLIFRPSSEAPAAASPLDLLFRGGPTARETFTRAYLSWAQPKVVHSFDKPVRIRVLSARGVSKHRMADWGLDASRPDDGRGDKCEGREVVALVVPEGHSDTRDWGLAAVPMDVDHSNYVLVSACAVSSRGPAIAVLASKQAALTVMSVSEAKIGRAGSLTGGGAVGVSFLVCGTSVCFVSARLGGAKDLFRILSTLKLRRSMFDVTNQFEHFYVAGVMGDLQWRRGNVPDDGPAARKYMSLGDGAKAYSLGNGLSVMRNSFPGLAVKDVLDSHSFWHQSKQSAATTADVEVSATSVRAEGASGPFPGTKAHDSYESLSALPRHIAGLDGSSSGPALSIAMVDEIVDGRPAPSLPECLSRCIVTISELRGEGIKMPPGIDQSTPLNSYFAVYSDYVGGDPVVTRPTGRPTDRPEWQEAVRLHLVPSDVDDVRRSFLLCQVMIPMPLADPIAAGHCVLPISYASNGRAEFTIPLRLAGIATGRVRGIIELEVGPDEGVNDEGNPDASALGDELFGLDDLSVNGYGADGNDSGGGDQSQAVSSQRQKSVSSFVGASGLSGLGLSGRASQSTPSLEEMNERVDIARRKGTKQIKNMVGKLSSFLGQPPSGSAGSGLARGDSSASRSGDLPGFVSQRSASGGGTFNERLPIGSESGVGENGARIRYSREVGDYGSPAPSQAEWSQPPILPSAPSPHVSRANSRSKSVHAPDPLLAGLAGQGSSRETSHEQDTSAERRGTDILLQSLPRAKLQETPRSAVLGEDDLLAGLRAAKVSSEQPALEMDDDDWGTFEEASAASTASVADTTVIGSTRGAATTSKGNLLDL